MRNFILSFIAIATMLALSYPYLPYEVTDYVDHSPEVREHLRARRSIRDACAKEAKRRLSLEYYETCTKEKLAGR